MHIYAISDTNLMSDLQNDVLRLLKCGIKFIQYRNKTKTHNIEVLKNLVQICEHYKAKFIINDDVNLALQTNAHGVHLGCDDISIKQARKILGTKAIIGASCYDSLELAKQACDNGASYVAFGSVFASKIKPNAKQCSLETITKAKEILPVKICAIGGINANNINKIKQAKADFAAIISALYENNNIETNIEILSKSIN